MLTSGPCATFLRFFTSLAMFSLVIALAGCTTPGPTPQPATSAPTEPPVSPATLTRPPATLAAPTEPPTAARIPILDPAWQEKVTGLRWVAYSPTNADPNSGIEAPAESILQDLMTLRQAGFTGLVTYASTGTLGRELPRIAQESGMVGLIVGIWNPTDPAELALAKQAAANPVVLGYCVGNEGLNSRYTLAEVTDAIQELKSATGKPATTSEEIDDYADAALLNTGDWVFPNAHPYFHSQIEADLAVRWTQAAYEDLSRRAGRLVIFKEVGLPTAGDPEGVMSEARQEEYYVGLAQTPARFVYFEAFDQLWKTHLPIEPYWGLFTADRTPKPLALSLMEMTPKTPTPGSDEQVFYVYKDSNFLGNHFKPSGYMGDIGDIQINEAYQENPHSGQTAIQVTYTAQGSPPNNCEYNPPCRWAGVYWQEPPNNWGKDEIWKDSGFNLTGYTRLKFWARAERPVTVEFKVGGINHQYGDSLYYPRGVVVNLTTAWQEFEIDLRDADLSHIIGGFVWVINWDSVGLAGIRDGKVVFYLDDIGFER